MDDIDFIKWMCELAGWKVASIIYDSLHMIVVFNKKKITVGSNSWKAVYYPLLLQRAIEGVNREACSRDDDYTYINVQQDCINYSYSVNSEWRRGNDGSTNIFYDNMVEDEAKESALKYIYEQEKNNG